MLSMCITLKALVTCFFFFLKAIIKFIKRVFSYQPWKLYWSESNKFGLLASRQSSNTLITSLIQQNGDANNGMQGVATAAQYNSRSLYKRMSYRWPLCSCWPKSHWDKPLPGSTVHLSTVRSVSAASRRLPWTWRVVALCWQQSWDKEGRRVIIWNKEGCERDFMPPSCPTQDQSFLVLLALAMFSWRFCFFFCSRSRASIILASFQESRALAMKRGVRARMTVVRKP